MRLLALYLLTFSLGCGLIGGEDDDSSDSSSEEDSGVLEISNELGVAFPKDLAVASPYAEVSDIDTLATQLEVDGAALLETTTPRDYLGRKAVILSILDGVGSEPCSFTFPESVSALNPYTEPACYGPGIQAQGFPDASSGDNSPGGQCSPAGGPSFDTSAFDDSCLPGGDLGFWEETSEDGSPCMAAKLNYEVERAGGLVDFAMKTYAMVLCAANQNGTALPTDTTAVDMLPAIEAVVTGNTGGDITAADVSLTSSGHYEVGLTATLTSGESMEVTIAHKSLSDDFSQSRGKVLIETQPGSAALVNNAADPYFISAEYDVASANDVKIEYRMTNARGDTSDQDRFRDDKNIVKIPGTDAEGQTQGFYWGILNLDGEAGTGKVATAWIAGNIQENVRSFIAELSGERGSLTGCGHFGFGVTLETLDSDPTTGWLDRMICNWAGPGHDGSREGQELVQRQCMTEQDDGSFSIDSSNIYYVPRNSCGTGSSESYPNGTFQWRHDSSGQSTTFTEFTKQHSLISVSDLETSTLTIPTRPTSLD